MMTIFSFYGEGKKFSNTPEEQNDQPPFIRRKTKQD